MTLPVLISDGLGAAILSIKFSGKLILAINGVWHRISEMNLLEFSVQTIHEVVDEGLVFFDTAFANKDAEVRCNCQLASLPVSDT